MFDPYRQGGMDPAAFSPLLRGVSVALSALVLVAIVVETLAALAGGVA